MSNFLSPCSKPSKHLRLRPHWALCFAHPDPAPLSGKRRRLLVLQHYSPALAPVLRYSWTCCRRSCQSQMKVRAAPDTTTLRASMNNMPTRWVCCYLSTFNLPKLLLSHSRYTVIHTRYRDVVHSRDVPIPSAGSGIGNFKRGPKVDFFFFFFVNVRAQYVAELKTRT